MKIVIIGGTGLIGSALTRQLRDAGHEVLAASPRTGVNAVTGEGLAAALAGAQVVVDVSNSPSFEDGEVLSFFQDSTRNLLAAAAAAGVKHLLALSVVGTERMQSSGYFRAKLAQEELIKAGSVPYTLLRATQFYEFMGAIAYTGAVGDTVHLSSAALQPIAAIDVSAALAKLAVEAPRNGTREVAGPEKLPLDQFVRRFMQSSGDARAVISAPDAPYFGAPLTDESLTPGANPILGATRFEAWLAKTAAA
ncbi:NAD-dependent epimerase/dehydratase family protein [Solimonas sp. K1W22B-7]|uniref:SDR family oxidoreductase n=1 Tax=Solimonas sp. K1W22B-7 TaxID=2303331 RepID=UPI000E32F0B4|nr:SDR family oxidoreductase [Solimonas sp. K1W22B-7]AXQ27198.1 NAD-dependent epimerase/dehydratase family protein [Solimonas sp. K1W22B-7]